MQKLAKIWSTFVLACATLALISLTFYIVTSLPLIGDKGAILWLYLAIAFWTGVALVPSVVLQALHGFFSRKASREPPHTNQS